MWRYSRCNDYDEQPFAEEMSTITDGEYRVPLGAASALAFARTRLEEYDPFHEATHVAVAGMDNTIPGDVTLLQKDVRVVMDKCNKILWLRNMQVGDYVMDNPVAIEYLKNGGFAVPQLTWADVESLLLEKGIHRHFNPTKTSLPSHLKSTATFVCDRQDTLPVTPVGLLIVSASIVRDSVGGDMLQNSPKDNYGIGHIRLPQDTAGIPAGDYLVNSNISDYLLTKEINVYHVSLSD